MRFFLILAVLVCIAPAVSAQEKCSTHARKAVKPWTWLKSNMCDEDYQVWVEPRRKHRWYKDKVFWTGVAIIGASIALDGHSTAKGQPYFREGNPLLGPHPSNGRIAGLAAIDFGAQFGFHYAAWRLSHNDPSRAWREAGRWGVSAGVFAINGRQAIKNYRLEARCPKAPIGCK